MKLSTDINREMVDELLHEELLETALNNVYSACTLGCNVAPRFIDTVDEVGNLKDEQGFIEHLRENVLFASRFPESMSFTDFYDIYRDRLISEYVIDISVFDDTMRED